MTMMLLQHCAAPGCTAESDHPLRDGWTWLDEYWEGVVSGFYCPVHRAELESAPLRRLNPRHIEAR